MEGSITLSTLDLQRLLDETAAVAVKRVLKEVGLTKDDISYSQAVKRYGKWFKDHYLAGRLKGEKKDIINKARVLETLKGIRQQLQEIRQDL